MARKQLKVDSTTLSQNEENARPSIKTVVHVALPTFYCIYFLPATRVSTHNSCCDGSGKLPIVGDCKFCMIIDLEVTRRLCHSTTTNAHMDSSRLLELKSPW